MKLNDISPAFGAKKKQKRLGRGMGSGLGKTCAAGHKGQKSRSGAGIPLGFEGGQMPMQRRLPKIGFSSKSKKIIAEICISKFIDIEEKVIDIALIKERGLAKKSATNIRIIGKLPESKKIVFVESIHLTKGAFDSINTPDASV